MNRRLRVAELQNEYSVSLAKVLNDKSIIDNNENIRKTVRELKELKAEVQDHADRLDLIKKLALDEDSKFKRLRLEYIETGIKSDLDVIFSEQNLVPRITLDNSRNSSKAELTLIDKQGNPRNPKLSASGLMKQLISFGATFCICSLLGSRILFVDEAFGASSNSNKRKIAKILQSAVDSGFQILLISQGAELYDELNRHQVNLKFDGERAIVESEEDYRNEQPSGVELY